MLNRSLSSRAKNDLCTAKQNIFAKVNSTNEKSHQEKKKEKSNFIIKKQNEAAKESIKKPRVTKVKLNEAELTELSV